MYDGASLASEVHSIQTERGFGEQPQAGFSAVPAHEAPEPNPAVTPANSPPSYSVIEYSVADPIAVERPDRDRFYDPTYVSTLTAMILHVVEVEAPIFEDVLVDRIARAHGLMRSGNQIRRLISELLSRTGAQRSAEGKRQVIWPVGQPRSVIHVFRKDPTGRRSHDDVPIEELAAIAAPFIRLRMSDEAVVRKIAEEFGLGRIRETTRVRFEAALQLAREAVAH